MQGSHSDIDDPRNADILVNVNGDLVPRHRATVSVFDAGFVLGDGVWEGLRLHRGRLVFLDEHLDRLLEGAKAIDLPLGRSARALGAEIYRTVEANGMRTDVHVRVMVTRGLKRTPHQDPRLTIGPATIVIVPEHKAPAPALYRDGLRLFTVHVRRGSPDVQDPLWNSHSKLNCIAACLQAIRAGADEALMLDPHGFVATGNSTNIFIVRRNEVWTSTGRYCLNGITRRQVIRLCRENGMPVSERDFSLTQAYAADEAFLTGTFGGIVPVRELDGRVLAAPVPGPITLRLSRLYEELLDRESAAAP